MGLYKFHKKINNLNSNEFCREYIYEIVDETLEEAERKFAEKHNLKHAILLPDVYCEFVNNKLYITINIDFTIPPLYSEVKQEPVLAEEFIHEFYENLRNKLIERGCIRVSK